MESSQDEEMGGLGTTAHSFDREICVVCQATTGEALSRVTYNGLDTLKVYFQNKENNEILNLLITFTVDTLNLKIHRTCQKNCSNYNNRVKRKPQNSNEKAKRPRHDNRGCFNWKESCFLCFNTCQEDGRNTQRNPFRLVRTIEMKDNILNRCNKRGCDEWAMKVMTRVNSCNDLVAVEARYHISCNKKFYSSNISHNDSVGSGRKTDDNKLNAFLQLCNWLDQECELELYSVGELHRIMETIAGTSDVYHKRYLKQKLIDTTKGSCFLER